MAPLIVKFLTALLALTPLSATAADAATTTSTSCSTITVTATVPPSGSYSIPAAVTAGATPMADMLGMPAMLGVAGAAVAAAMAH